MATSDTCAAASAYAQPPRTLQPELVPDRRLARVLDFMSARLHEPLSLERLAREAGISVHRSGRRFREQSERRRVPGCRRCGWTRPGASCARPGCQWPTSRSPCGDTRPAAFAAAFLRRAGTTPRIYRRDAGSSLERD